GNDGGAGTLRTMNALDGGMEAGQGLSPAGYQAEAFVGLAAGQQPGPDGLSRRGLVQVMLLSVQAKYQVGVQHVLVKQRRLKLVRGPALQELQQRPQAGLGFLGQGLQMQLLE